jgi:ATP-dependent helicase/DNAse subunit B
LSLDARAFGELVHELLKRTVDALEPQPGFGRSTRHEIEDALTASVTATRAQWPLERSTPPSLLWQHTLEAAATRALAALTFDPGLLPGTRSWTEVPFGQSGVETGADLPWDPNVPVQIPGTNIRICGSIDRLDLRSAPDAVQVSDYKTGVEPKSVSEIVFRGGAELQRVIYACATRQLLPEITRVFARLIFLGEDKPNSYRLADVDGAITEITSCVASACTLLTDGSALPGPDAEESWNEFRLALPAAPETYFEVKRSALARAFGSFSRVWSRR